MGDEKPAAWVDLAGNGSLEMRPEKLLGLAEMCVSVTDAVLGAQKFVGDVLHLDPFSCLDHGAKLAGRFNDRGSELDGFLRDHITILGDMAQAFITAGKLYAGADSASAADFDGIVIPTESTHDWSSPPPEQFAKKDLNYTFFLESPLLVNGGIVGELEQWPSILESGNAENLHHQGLSDLHDSIDASRVYYAADVWYWIADELAVASEAFIKGLGDAMAGGWTGLGAAAAIPATQAYIDDFELLRTGMYSTSYTLAYAADCLSQTWFETADAKMPESDFGKRDVAQYPDTEMLNRVRRGVNDWYWGHESGHISVHHADSMIPKLMPPTSPVRGSLDTTDGDGPGFGPSPGPASMGPVSTGDFASPAAALREAPGSGGNTSSGGLDGLSGLGQALQQAADGAKDVRGGGKAPDSSAPNVMAASARPTGSGPSSGPGGGLGKDLGKLSSNFPRAGQFSTGLGGASSMRAGATSSGATPGTPGAAGTPGRGGGRDENERKRPDYLASEEHIEEAIGDPQVVARPVLDVDVAP
ncbi:hypothetical protein ACFVMC_01950 [Nocardia sp. NPDC127579]|uniref:hypothetical protein n=1 Tax=Nocardia sp. NPDC127579 TaxID=3345402 RepID=UPI00363D938C